MRKVVVTGLGTINPLGNTVQKSWEALIKSKEIRPQRITILDKSTQKQIEEAALATGVIG